MSLYDDVLAALPDDVPVRDPAGRDIKPPFVIVLMAGGELADGRLFDTVEVYCAGAYDTDTGAEATLARLVDRVVRALNASPVMIVEAWTTSESDQVNDAEQTISYLTSTITVRAPL